MTERRWLFAIAGICLLLYLPGLFGPLTFDSVVALVRNERLGVDIESFQAWRLAIDSSSAGPTGRPISMFSFALSHALFGHSAVVEKSINLAIHLATGYLLYIWLRLLLSSAPATGWPPQRAQACALIAALFWLLNPMQVSTVLYAVQRMEQLSSLFILLGVYLYTRHRSAWCERGATPSELSRAAFHLGLLTLAAVFSKEDGILLLPILALLEASLFQGRYNGVRRTGWHWGAILLSALPVIALVLYPWLEPAWMQQRGSWRGIDSTERMMTQARVLWHYVSLFYWPDVSRMSLFHDDIQVSRALLDPWTTAPATLAWMLVMGACLALSRRLPLLLFCVGFYLFTHGIESTVLPLDLAYEHRSYLGNAGLALLLAAFLYHRVPPVLHRRVAIILLLPFVVALGWRSTLWGNELRLYEAQLRHHPRSERTAYYYANVRMRLADEVDDEALSREHVLAARRYFEYLLELDPLHLPATVSLLYIDSRWFPGLPQEERIAELQEIARLRQMEPSDTNALDLWQRCLLAGFCEIPEPEMVGIIETLAARYPHSAVYPAFLSRHYGELRRDFTLASDYGRAAIEAAPADPSGYYLLASWYLAQGRLAEAAQLFGELLGSDPDLATIRNVEQAIR